MSSDTYRVNVLSVEGADVVMEVRPTTAGAPAPTWYADPELASRVAAALAPRLHGFRAEGALAFVLDGSSARLCVELSNSWVTLRSMLDVRIVLVVPAIST